MKMWAMGITNVHTSTSWKTGWGSDTDYQVVFSTAGVSNIKEPHTIVIFKAVTFIVPGGYFSSL